MSKLYHTEKGHAIPTLAEELTTFRRARKKLELPPTEAPAKLYFMARAWTDSRIALRVAINGTEIEPVAPELDVHWWYTLTIDPALLKEGENIFEFWCDSRPMNAWSLAIEPGHGEPDSFISDDGGATWRNNRMCYLNALSGEYLVRVRLAEGSDPAPPRMVFNDPAHPRLAALCQILPPAARDASRPALERVRAISTWLASSWEHTPWGASLGVVCTPWDPETILAWPPDQCGHNGLRPMANCIFFGVTFANAVQAIGIPGRCAIWAGKPGKADGHFTAEWWSTEHQKWALVDPNFDAMFLRDGMPLSTRELQVLSAAELHALTEYGPGVEKQLQNSRVVHWMHDGERRARSLENRAVWYRADQLTHPEFNPVSHGAGTAYAETGIVWERGAEEIFGMHCLFGDQSYFDAPPA